MRQIILRPQKPSRAGVTWLDVIVFGALVGLLVFGFSAWARRSTITGCGGSRRSWCKNNLKQWGLALHNYHDTFRCFPPYAGGTSENGERLSEDEIIANAALMVFAGHETTMNLLANGIVAFHNFPKQWELLRANPDLARTATEEILRFDGPIRALGRWAKESFDFHGQQIEAGERVLLVQHGANRDPAAFKDPDTLDITRWPNRHAAFGQGIHTCLGAPLARLEVVEALGYLASQFRSIEVTTPKLEYNPTMVSRSLKELQVRFHAQ